MSLPPHFFFFSPVHWPIACWFSPASHPASCTHLLSLPLQCWQTFWMGMHVLPQACVVDTLLTEPSPLLWLFYCCLWIPFVTQTVELLGSSNMCDARPNGRHLSMWVSEVLATFVFQFCKHGRNTWLIWGLSVSQGGWQQVAGTLLFWEPAFLVSGSKMPEDSW